MFYRLHEFLKHSYQNTNKSRVLRLRLRRIIIRDYRESMLNTLVRLAEQAVREGVNAR